MERLSTEIRAIVTANQRAVIPRQNQAHDRLRHSLYGGGTVLLFTLGIAVALVKYFQRSLYRERALENTKSEFLSLASHQLRTPATNVKQYIGLLMDGYLGGLTRKQKDALAIAYRNNDLEIRIVNDLLDVAKLDLKRIQLSKQSVNVASIVRQVAEEFETIAQNRNQSMTVTVPNRLQAHVDRTYFKGVVEKLINAIKYSREGTNIKVKLVGPDEENWFKLIVRDRGVGMQKREIPKLFMKFSRLNNEFSASSEGSGTGLYWVKQIVELHGGTINVATREGSGSKFTVRLPVA